MGYFAEKINKQLHKSAQMVHILRKQNMNHMVAGEGFEPSKAEPGDLQIWGKC